jgi:hypothetical protein
MRATTAVLALLLISVSVDVAGDEGHAPPPPQDARLEFLKSLEGRWVGEPMHEGMPPASHEFRVTAGGHAVEEREMIGTPMEMLTVYTMSGDDLVATHYCALGNQPRLVASRTVGPDGLSFRCDGKPGNSRSHDEEHVHGWTLRVDADGRLHYDAQLVEGGKPSMAPSTVLSRAPDTASR